MCSHLSLLNFCAETIDGAFPRSNGRSVWQKGKSTLIQDATERKLAPPNRQSFQQDALRIEMQGDCLA
jgi:hypothetical protein